MPINDSLVCMLQAQAEAQTSRAREAAFQGALQELTLFKSRTAAALLQVHALLLAWSQPIRPGCRDAYDKGCAGCCDHK